MKKFNIDFVGKSKIFFSISGILLAVIIGLSFFMTKIDIEFSGGAVFTYSYTGNVADNDIKAVVKQVLNSDSSIVRSVEASSKKTNLQIRLVESGAVSSEKQAELSNKITEKFKDNAIKMVNVRNVDAAMGAEFFEKCMMAIGFAFILLVLYIAFRFRKIGGWSAGVVAIACLLHDVLFVFGAYVIFQIPLNNNFVAAVLTILGYSINSTIVLYDRIRENKSLGLRLKLPELVNKSINDTLLRNISSNVTTIMAMVIVCIVAFICSIDAIISFAVPLVIGLVVGAYSSCCLSGPLWVTWQEHKSKKAKAEK